MLKESIVVADIIKGFMEPGHPLYLGDDARRIIPCIKNLLDRKRGAQVIFVCDNHAPDDEEFKMFPPHCIRGTEETEVIDELKPYQASAVTIPKTRYSAFYNTELERLLKEYNPDKVIMAGVCTDICVLHTVADLRARNYTVEVPRDCVATFDDEAHEWALKHIDKILGAHII